MNKVALVTGSRRGIGLGILKALAKVLPLSLDTLINPNVSPEDEGANQMKMLYCSCPSEMRETLLHHTQETAKELTELSEKFETN